MQLPAVEGHVADILVYLVGAGVVGLVSLALRVWVLGSQLHDLRGEVNRLRDWRHRAENDALGERLRQKYGNPETD